MKTTKLSRFQSLRPKLVIVALLMLILPGLSAGTEQIVQQIDLIGDRAETTASGTQNISAAAEEQLASMEEISTSAASLSQMAEELHTLVQKFKV